VLAFIGSNLSLPLFLYPIGVLAHAGDLGYTPLQVACMQGNAEIVKLLTDSGADVFALSEGDAPFATARLGGHDNICELLAPLMGETQKRDRADSKGL
jgi:ankyrin repeat protein